MINTIFLISHSEQVGNVPFQVYDHFRELLFDLILYVHSTIFQLCRTGLPGLNQY